MRRAVRRRRWQPEQVAELFASCERFEALADGDVAPLVKENMHFHSTIVDAAASGRVAELVRKVIELPLVYRSYIWYSPEQRRISGALPPPDRRGDRGAGRRPRASR